MKLLMLTIFFFTNLAWADVENCLQDAKNNAHHVNPIKPKENCADIIKNLSNKVEAKDSTGKKHVYGFRTMFYVDLNGKKTLMAGDQTELKALKFIRYHEPTNKILVFQSDDEVSSISTFNADFVGNVAPVSFYLSDKLNNVTNMSLLDDLGEMALCSKDDQSVTFLNQLADSRYKGPEFDPTAKRILKGKKTSIWSPQAVVYSNLKREIYVIDQARVLVFAETSTGDVAPLRIIDTKNINGATGAVLDSKQEKIFVYADQRKLHEISLK
jgi:hypothetical protein